MLTTRDGEPGLNWLCAGLKEFFAHANRNMQIMAQLMRKGHNAEAVMRILEKEKKEQEELFVKAGRNEPCPCGSGKKYKQCHGRTDHVEKSNSRRVEK